MPIKSVPPRCPFFACSSQFKKSGEGRRERKERKRGNRLRFTSRTPRKKKKKISREKKGEKRERTSRQIFFPALFFPVDSCGNCQRNGSRFHKTTQKKLIDQ